MNNCLQFSQLSHNYLSKCFVANRFKSVDLNKYPNSAKNRPDFNLSFVCGKLNLTYRMSKSLFRPNKM